LGTHISSRRGLEEVFDFRETWLEVPMINWIDGKPKYSLKTSYVVQLVTPFIKPSTRDVAVADRMKNIRKT